MSVWLGVLGCVLMALPFVALFVFISRELGVKEAAAAFALVALVGGVILAGTYLAITGFGGTWEW